jgi:hypothetical protein
MCVSIKQFIFLKKHIEQWNKIYISQKSLLCCSESFLKLLLQKIISTWKEYYSYLRFLMSLDSYFENVWYYSCVYFKM